MLIFKIRKKWYGDNFFSLYGYATDSRTSFSASRRQPLLFISRFRSFHLRKWNYGACYFLFSLENPRRYYFLCCLLKVSNFSLAKFNRNRWILHFWGFRIEYFKFCVFAVFAVIAIEVFLEKGVAVPAVISLV